MSGMVLGRQHGRRGHTERDHHDDRADIHAESPHNHNDHYPPRLNRRRDLFRAVGQRFMTAPNIQSRRALGLTGEAELRDAVPASPKPRRERRIALAIIVFWQNRASHGAAQSGERGAVSRVPIGWRQRVRALPDIRGGHARQSKWSSGLTRPPTPARDLFAGYGETSP